MSLIHATALVDPKAELDSSVQVGPYTIIGPNVRIGAGTTVGRIAWSKVTPRLAMTTVFFSSTHWAQFRKTRNTRVSLAS